MVVRDDNFLFHLSRCFGVDIVSQAFLRAAQGISPVIFRQLGQKFSSRIQECGAALALWGIDHLALPNSVQKVSESCQIMLSS